MNYPVHPAAEYFPPLSTADLQDLADDIHAHGLHEPIKLFEGQILDGRNRYEACLLAGVEPQFSTLPDDINPYDYVWSENAMRRHMDKGALTVIRVRQRQASADYQQARQRRIEEANQRRREAALEQPRNDAGHFETGACGIPHAPVNHRQPQDNRENVDIAQDVGVHPDTARVAMTLVRKRPDLADRVQREELSLNAAVRQMKRESPPPIVVLTDPSVHAPVLFVGQAHALPLPDACVDIIITSPPYNIGPKGGHPEWRQDGRSVSGGRAWAGIEGEMRLPEEDYQRWQLAVLKELFRVAKPGASLFYNHKVRQRDGHMLHPMQWLSRVEAWTLRQELIWDRGSTHNHEPTYFWPHDERIYWLTKGKPSVPAEGIRQSTVWSFHGPVSDTWHVSPFPEELPRRCLEAIGAEGKVVLDPFGGSMTVCAVALAMGAKQAIGCDINHDHLKRACAEHGWQLSCVQTSSEMTS